MIQSKDFDVIKIEDSTIEFVIVARGPNGFIPVMISENCGLDVMGFAASKGFMKEEFGGVSVSEARKIRSDIDEYHEMAVETDFEQSSSVFFYWKGALPHEKDDFWHVCKSSLRRIFNEGNDWRKSPQAFFSWHLGPIIFLIERENGYQEIRRKREQYGRKRFETWFSIVTAFGAVVLGVYAVGAGSDLFEAMRAWLDNSTSE